MHFLFTHSGCYSSSAAFSWPNWEQYLLELIFWFFRRTSQQRTPCQSHHIHSITFFDGWWWVNFAWPMSSSIPHYCAVLFPLPITFCFKNRMFSLHLSRVTCGNVIKKDFFFFLLNLCDKGFPCFTAGKESAFYVGDLGLIPGLRRPMGDRKGCPL